MEGRRGLCKNAAVADENRAARLPVGVGGVPRAQDVATPAAETIEVRRLAVDDVDEQLDALAEVLVDCVAGGASVSYLMPFSREDARAVFREFAAEVGEGRA